MRNPIPAYRQAIIDAINTLSVTEHQIFGAALGILMTDEWKGTHDAFEIGDAYNFELSQLESSQDINVKTLVDLIKTIRTNIQTLQNNNGIIDSEINW